MNKFKQMTNWIERKDLAYWLAFIVVIWLLSSKFGKNNQPLLDNWNFAATIVSIILAVLAIVYTYAQSTTTLHSTQKLGESAIKIDEASEKLKAINVDGLFKNIETKINNLEINLDLKVGKHLEDHFTKMVGSLNHNDVKSPLDMEELLSEEQWEKYVSTYFKADYGIIGLALVLAYYKKYRKLDVTYQDFALWFAKKANIEENSEYIYGYLQGVLDIFESLNIITFEEIEGKSRITKISKNLEEVIKRKIDVDEPSEPAIKIVKQFLDSI